MCPSVNGGTGRRESLATYYYTSGLVTELGPEARRPVCPSVSLDTCSCDCRFLRFRRTVLMSTTLASYPL